jgi:hypothetical protein
LLWLSGCVFLKRQRQSRQKPIEAAVSYANFLVVLISYGSKIREHWPLILAAYQALVELYKVFNQPVPGEGVLAVVAPTPDELDSEERLAILIDGDSQAIREPGRFRRVFDFLKATGLLDSLLGKVLGS